jgi:hypothetical protein
VRALALVEQRLARGERCVEVTAGVEVGQDLAGDAVDLGL